MRTTFPRLIAALTLLCTATVFGQSPELFKKLDKNQDGVIEPDEVEGEGRGLFERMLRNADENKDGKLTKDEFAKGLAARPATSPASDAGDSPARLGTGEMLKRLDKNGDGKLSKEEAPERLVAIFDRIDTNKDGQLDKAELGRVIQAMAGAAPRSDQPSGETPPESVGTMLLTALDADRNGELSAAEIADAPKVLAKFDKNGDGKIVHEELLAHLPAARAGTAGRPGPLSGNLPSLDSIKQQLKAADANGDGKLSKDEAPEGLRPVFDRIDANGDGQLEVSEVREYIMKVRPGQ